MASATRTHLVFQHHATLLRLRTQVVTIRPFGAIEEANRSIFKEADPDKDHVVVAQKTIFHPQGGGQPSDEGSMSFSRPGGETVLFSVRAARMDVVNAGLVLHLGHFADPSQSGLVQPDQDVDQTVDAEKRLYYSKLHTAGHVLGASVRKLLEKEIPGFDELKASHFPNSAACEFRGLIEAKWKEPIQKQVDDYINQSMPVEIDFWTEDDFRQNGLERLIPDRKLLPPGEDRFRVVKIVGAEVYPCGGTHVATTGLCGETTVRKISRAKGISRVSYAVAQ